MSYIGKTDTTPGYYLLRFDAAGKERPDPDPDGPMLSDAILKQFESADAPSDVVMLCHGWFVDEAAAKADYTQWLGAAGGVDWPREGTPLIVGISWPANAFPSNDGASAAGEAAGVAAAAVPDLTDDAAQRRLVQKTAMSLAPDATDREPLETQLRTIVDPSNYTSADAPLPPDVSRAYRRLATLLRSESALTDPHQSRFSAPAAHRQWAKRRQPAPVPALDGIHAEASAGPSSITDGIHALLNAFTFWAMRQRAITIGSTGVGDFMKRMLDAGQARVHLMGHSFGCLVWSAAIQAASAQTRPVHTFFLVQAAESTWAFSPTTPYAHPSVGGFANLVSNKLVEGAVVATHSGLDYALGRFYPLGMEFSASQAAAMVAVGEDPAPEALFGSIVGKLLGTRTAAIGAVGMHFNLSTGVVAGNQLPALLSEKRQTAPGQPPQEFALVPRGWYAIDCSDVICDTSDRLIGAHSDIAHVELARLFLQAIALDA